MINQLRIYRIPEGAEAPFLARFRDHAARLMRRHGFRILAMWTAPAHDGPEDAGLDFAYLLAWQDEAEMKARWAAFMADAEWAEIKRTTSAEHGVLVVGNQDWTLTPVDFSAALTAQEPST